jgi:hypothetical protein
MFFRELSKITKLHSIENAMQLLQSAFYLDDPKTSQVREL